MASKNTKARAQSYSMLTDIEKNILKRHYDGGMVGTGRKYQAMITRAVEETDLARERVEKWIGNERNKRRQSGATEQQSKKVKLPPMQRGPNPYNLFCAEIFRTGKLKVDIISELSCESRRSTKPCQHYNARPICWLAAV
ncbi:hypothetical protein OS493_037236 [Desmophyllum pertusum]|uniref:Uncharacterized protein n=1 Tax=Desmophyllum pertusum TaxID=174260 RepID=A0A9W9ZI44_9CNID|nr:hypothetical protein OS493_037236 [Desmophyllum pertusum]